MTSAKEAFGNSIGIHKVGHLTQKQYISANPKERFIAWQEASSTQSDLEHTSFYNPGPPLLTRKVTLAYFFVEDCVGLGKETQGINFGAEWL